MSSARANHSHASGRGRRFILRALAVVVGVGLLLSLLGFGLFRSDPSWYRRVQLTDAEQAAAQQRLLDRLATLRNDVGRAQAEATTTPARPRPFDIELTEDEVNGVIMRWADTEPNLRAALRHIDEPHVRFLDDRIEFAGRVRGSLVNIELSVEQTDAGPRVQLGRPWAGRMPLSRSLLDDAGAAAVTALRQQESDALRGLPETITALLAGDEVDPIVPLPSSVEGKGLIAAKLEKLTIADGKLKATLRPVE